MLACLTGSRQWVIRSFLLIHSLSARRADDLRSNCAVFLRYAGFSGQGVATTDARKRESRVAGASKGLAACTSRCRVGLKFDDEAGEDDDGAQFRQRSSAILFPVYL